MKRMLLFALLFACVACCGEEQDAFAAPKITKPTENAAVAERPFGPSLVPAQSAEAVDKARNERYYALGLMEMKEHRPVQAAMAFGEAIKADRRDWRSYSERGDAFRMLATLKRMHYRDSAVGLGAVTEYYIWTPHLEKDHPEKRAESVQDITRVNEAVLAYSRMAIRDYNRSLALGDGAATPSALRGRGAAYGMRAAHAEDMLCLEKEEESYFRLLDLSEPENRAKRLGWRRLDKKIYTNAAASIEVDAAKALDNYNEALRHTPNDALAYEGRGDVYDTLGRYRLAATGAPSGYWAERLLRRSTPADAPPFDLSDYKRALASYEKAAALSTEPATLWMKIGGVQTRAFDDVQAFASYGRAEEVPETREAALHARAGLHISAGNRDAFSADMNGYLANHPDLSFATGIMFQLDRLKNQVEEILEATDKLAAAPQDGKLYAYRAERWQQCRKFLEAASDYTRAIDLGEDDASIYWRRGDSYQKMRQWHRALADYDRAEARGYLKEVLSRSDARMQEQQARGSGGYLNLSDESLATASESEAAQFYICRAMARSGTRQYAAAARDYTQAIRHAPDLSALYFRRYICHVNMGLQHLAAADLWMLTLRYPKFKDPYQILVRHYEKVLHADAKALACYDKLIALEAQYLWNYFDRAIIFDRLGEEEKAAADFKTWAKGIPVERYLDRYKEVPEKYRAAIMASMHRKKALVDETK